MLRGAGARNKTRECQLARRSVENVTQATSTTYRESGIGSGVLSADPGNVNVHATLPTRWVQLVMLALNLVVWLDAATRVGV